MRVLLVSDFCLPLLGGLEIHLDALATELVALGHDVHIATMMGDARASDPAVNVHVIDNALASRLPYRDEGRQFHLPVPDPRSRRQLSALIDRVRPDVVDAHNWLGVSVPRARDIPLIFTAQDYAFVCHIRTLFTQPDGRVCAGPSPARCFRCGTAGRGAAGTVVMGVGTALGRRWMRPDAVIACSGYVAEQLRPVVHAPLHVVPNFSNQPVPAVTGRAALDPSGEPVVMFAGQPVKHKGLDLLLDIWESVEPPTARLFVASTGPVGRALPPGVSVSTLTPPEVAAAWARATVAVVPSVWAEPFGMTAVEALRAGLPTIVSASGGLREIVRDGVEGLHVPAGDGAALRAAIESLLADPGLRAGMGAAALQRAEDFRPDVVTAQVVAVYEEAIARRRADAR